MELLPIDPSLLDLHGVDEDESEAVAICLLEFVFAETNAQYRQHCLAQEAIKATATLLSTSIFDAVASAVLQPEVALNPRRFDAEPSPVAEVNDRHAARCLPHRSPEKPEVWPDRSAAPGSPTHRSKSDSHAGERTRASVVKRRRKPEFNAVVKSNLVTIPQVITLPEVIEEESPDDRAWRIKCMKELNGDGGKSPSKLGAMSKWATFTRRPSLVEPRVSLEVEVIDNAPPLLRQEVSGAASANAVKMKSSLNTFSAISTPSVRQGSATSTTSRAKEKLFAGGSKRPSLAGSQSAPVLAALEPRKGSVFQLNDALSRKRTTTLGTPNSHLQHGSSSSSSADLNPWRFDSEDGPPSAFAPDMMVASAASIPTGISLTAGVGFMYGESTVKGPERRENNHTMSRKRFELHQRLATDYLMQESMLLQQPSLSPTSGAMYSSGSVSPLSTHSQHPHKQSPRPYATVPPDPVPIPSLSPIAKDALVIPRNHLAQSASTPHLRVRNSSALKRSETESCASLPAASSGELEALRRIRPSTALGAVVVTSPRKLGSKASKHDGPRPKTSAGSAATAKYLREFPKPHAGTIQLNAKKTGAALDPATDVDSARQRMAWIS